MCGIQKRLRRREWEPGALATRDRHRQHRQKTEKKRLTSINSLPQNRRNQNPPARGFDSSLLAETTEIDLSRFYKVKVKYSTTTVTMAQEPLSPCLPVSLPINLSIPVQYSTALDFINWVNSSMTCHGTHRLQNIEAGRLRLPHGKLLLQLQGLPHEWPAHAQLVHGLSNGCLCLLHDILLLCVLQHYGITV